MADAVRVGHDQVEVVTSAVSTLGTAGASSHAIVALNGELLATVTWNRAEPLADFGLRVVAVEHQQRRVRGSDRAVAELEVRARVAEVFGGLGQDGLDRRVAGPRRG